METRHFLATNKTVADNQLGCRLSKCIAHCLGFASISPYSYWIRSPSMLTSPMWPRLQAVAEMAPISSAFEARWSRAVSDLVSWEFESQKHPFNAHLITICSFEREHIWRSVNITMFTGVKEFWPIVPCWEWQLGWSCSAKMDEVMKFLSVGSWSVWQHFREMCLETCNHRQYRFPDVSSKV